MKKRTTIGLFSLVGMLALLLGGCSSGGSSSSEETPPPKFYFKASDTSFSVTSVQDLFGNAVAISGDGNTLAVGAWTEDSADSGDDSNNLADGAGAVYVFKRNESAGVVSWSQVAYVKAPTPVTSENFGYSVSLSEDGDTLAVGAPDIAGTTAGEVNVYISPSYDTASAITISGSTNGDKFGEAVALSDDGLRLAIGAPGSGSGAGAVSVYRSNGGLWNLSDDTSALTPLAGAGLGRSVALNQDGTVLAAGAWTEDSIVPALVDSGVVYWSTRLVAGTTWSAETKLEASDKDANDNFGVAVALNDDGDRLAVGGSGADAVYVFTGDAAPPTSWTEEEIVTASNTQAGDSFGISVALNSAGDRLLVGANLEDGSGTDIGSTVDELADGAGAAYLFTRDAVPSWPQQSYIKATNTDSGDKFGASVSINDSGTRIAIGAPSEASISTGVNGDQTDDSQVGTGAAYLWNL